MWGFLPLPESRKQAGLRPRVLPFSPGRLFCCSSPAASVKKQSECAVTQPKLQPSGKQTSGPGGSQPPGLGSPQLGPREVPRAAVASHSALPSSPGPSPAAAGLPFWLRPQQEGALPTSQPPGTEAPQRPHEQAALTPPLYRRLQAQSVSYGLGPQTREGRGATWHPGRALSIEHTLDSRFWGSAPPSPPPLSQAGGGSPGFPSGLVLWLTPKFPNNCGAHLRENKNPKNTCNCSSDIGYFVKKGEHRPMGHRCVLSRFNVSDSS